MVTQSGVKRGCTVGEALLCRRMLCHGETRLYLPWLLLLRTGAVAYCGQCGLLCSCWMAPANLLRQVLEGCDPVRFWSIALVCGSAGCILLFTGLGGPWDPVGRLCQRCLVSSLPSTCLLV